MKGKTMIETTFDENLENESPQKTFEYYLKGILPQLMLFILITQEFSLCIMGVEAIQKSFYDTQSYQLLILRYILIIVTYYMFSKDYKSVA